MLFLSILIFSAAARAETASSSADWSSFFANTSGTYSSALGGPTLYHPNGDLDGNGSNLSWENSLEFSLKLAEEWKLNAGGGIVRRYRPVDPADPNRRDTDILDPFLNLSRGRILEIGTLTLEARVRYYFPLSESTKVTLKQRDDRSRGTVNLGAFPYWTLLDENLAFAHHLEFEYRIDKSAAADRENYSVKAGVNISYALSRKLKPSLEFTTGSLWHNNSGHWDKLRKGQRVIAALEYFPLNALSIKPSLAWGANNTFRLNRAELGLSANYAFL